MSINNLRDSLYAAGQLTEQVGQTGRAFQKILVNKPAEPPIDQQQVVYQQQPTPQQVQQAHYERQVQHQQQTVYPNGQQVQYRQDPYAFNPYIPKPPAPRYKVDEDFLRKMARLKASTHLKYLETAGRFARNVVGNMAASNAMVELVEKLNRGEKLTPQETEMANSVIKAVEQRHRIEVVHLRILDDDEMREIYEELLFQDMFDQNERGELQLQNPNEFLWNYGILMLAEIAESGKEVIGNKVSGAYKAVTKKLKL